MYSYYLPFYILKNWGTSLGFKSKGSSYILYSYNHNIAQSKDIQVLIKNKKQFSAG